MDPARKRAIRLTIALTVALLLASALVYTSFSAGRDELTASQLLKDAKPGQSYILAGTVLNGSVRHRARGHRHGAAPGCRLRRAARLADHQVSVEVRRERDRLTWPHSGAPVSLSG